MVCFNLIKFRTVHIQFEGVRCTNTIFEVVTYPALNFSLKDCSKLLCVGFSVK